MTLERVAVAVLRAALQYSRQRSAALPPENRQNARSTIHNVQELFCRFLLASTFFQESPFLQFGECLLELLLGIHHDRTIPGNRFLEWFS